MNALEFWYEALHSRYGIRLRIKSGDRTAARDKLYAERRKAEDPALSKISIVVSPFSEDELWLVKKDAPNAADQD